MNAACLHISQELDSDDLHFLCICQILKSKAATQVLHTVWHQVVLSVNPYVSVQAFYIPMICHSFKFYISNRWLCDFLNWHSTWLTEPKLMTIRTILHIYCTIKHLSKVSNILEGNKIYQEAALSLCFFLLKQIVNSKTDWKVLYITEQWSTVKL